MWKGLINEFKRKIQPSDLEKPAFAKPCNKNLFVVLQENIID